MKITEVSEDSMFWGVTLEGGKHYAQTVQKSFHISMAALEPEQGSKRSEDLDGKHSSVMIHHDKAEFLLCTLTHGRLYQQPLDLNFTEGEEVRFFLNGPGIVHLTGYLTPDEPLEDEAAFSEDEADSSYLGEEESSDEDSSDQDSDEEEDSDEEVPKLKPIKFSMDSSSDSSPEKSSKKRKKSQKDKKRKKKKRIESSSEEEESEEEDSEADSEEDDEVMEEDDEDSEWETDDSHNFIDDEAEEADSDEEESEESEEDEHMVASSGSFLQPQKSKVKKEIEKLKKEKQKESPKKSVKKEQESPKTNGKGPTENGTPETSKKKKKKKKKNKEKDDEINNAADTSPSKMNTSNSSASPEKSPKPKKRTIKGGINVEDVKEGHGPEATQGKTVAVYYTGKLENGKQFDACQSGKPFKFKLGKGEVIKGWDNGVAGMKVGGKRKLLIPPSQGYGSQKMGPIPRNSTLHFEVELKAVS